MDYGNQWGPTTKTEMKIYKTIDILKKWNWKSKNSNLFKALIKIVIVSLNALRKS